MALKIRFLIDIVISSNSNNFIIIVIVLDLMIYIQSVRSRKAYEKCTHSLKSSSIRRFISISCWNFFHGEKEAII